MTSYPTPRNPSQSRSVRPTKSETTPALTHICSLPLRLITQQIIEITMDNAESTARLGQEAKQQANDTSRLNEVARPQSSPPPHLRRLRDLQQQGLLSRSAMKRSALPPSHC